MKERKWIFGLAVLPLLLSCGGASEPGGDSSSSPSISESVLPSESVSSNQEESSLDPLSVISEKLQDTLAKMKEGNFSLTYTIGSLELTDVITASYCYTGYLNSGSMLLQTYADAPIAYDFALKSGKLEIRGQSFTEDYSAQGVKDLAWKNKFASYQPKPVPLTKNKSAWSCADSELISLFSAQLDFTGIQRILFSISEEGDLIAEFQGLDGIGLFQTVEGGVVRIHDLGSSSLQEAEDFLASYSLSADSLSGKGGNLFGNASFVSALYDANHLDEYDSIERLGFSNLDVYGDYLRITDVSEEGSSTSITYHKKDASGELEIIGVNGQNQEVSASTSTQWGDFGLLGESEAKLDQFRKLSADDDYYTYLGEDATGMALAFTQHLPFKQWKVQEIKARVVDGKVTQLLFSTGLLRDSYSGTYFYRYADTRVQATANVIEGAKKKEASEHDDQIKGYLSYLNQDSSVFTSVEKDSAWSNARATKIVKGEDFYLKGTYFVEEDVISDRLESLGQGYYQKNGEVYQFSFDESGNVEFKQNPVGMSLSQIAGWTLSSEVLTLNEGKLTSYGDIIDIGASLGQIYNPLTVDPASLVMSVQDGKIASMDFSYYGGTEQVAFDYSPVSLPAGMKEKLDQAIEGLNPTQRADWSQSKSTAVYEEMVNFYGEEAAKKIPFLYDASYFAGNDFDYDLNDYEEPYYFKVYMTAGKDLDYADKYIAYLLSLGYVDEGDSTYVSDSDGFKIVVNLDSGNPDFLFIYKL